MIKLWTSWEIKPVLIAQIYGKPNCHSSPYSPCVKVTFLLPSHLILVTLFEFRLVWMLIACGGYMCWMHWHFLSRRTISPPHTPNNNFCCVLGAIGAEDCIRTGPSSSIPGFNSSASCSGFPQGSGNRSPRGNLIKQPLGPRALSVHCKLSEQEHELCGIIQCQLTSSGMRSRIQGQQCFQSTHVPGALIGHNSFQAICFYMFIPGACGEMELATTCRFILQGSLKQFVMLPAVKGKLMLQTLFVFSLFTCVRGLVRGLSHSQTPARGQKSLDH